MPPLPKNVLSMQVKCIFWYLIHIMFKNTHSQTYHPKSVTSSPSHDSCQCCVGKKRVKLSGCTFSSSAHMTGMLSEITATEETCNPNPIMSIQHLLSLNETSSPFLIVKYTSALMYNLVFIDLWKHYHMECPCTIVQTHTHARTIIMIWSSNLSKGPLPC